jgi:prepilin-type N-terminal cleavage/methylation domain-containing protein
MAKQNTKSKNGFTIIEVVLVLAIAGLIFLMVFIALPALQRSQRDTQRRDDMARFMSQLSQYQSNNGGTVPGDDKSNWNAAESSSTDKDNSFIHNYLKAGDDKFEDPSTGNTYKLGKDVIPCGKNANPCGSDAANEEQMGIIYIYKNAKCDGEKPIYVEGNRKLAVTIKLEGAGVYCGNN